MLEEKIKKKYTFHRKKDYLCAEMIKKGIKRGKR